MYFPDKKSAMYLSTVSHYKNEVVRRSEVDSRRTNSSYVNLFLINYVVGRRIGTRILKKDKCEQHESRLILVDNIIGR